MWITRPPELIPQNSGPFVPHAALYAPQFYALQKHLKVAPAHGLRRRPVGRCGHPLKGALLQAFVVDHKAAAIPDQHLYLCAPTVEKHVHLAVEARPTLTVDHQTLQTVETLAHVRRTLADEVPKGGAEGHHPNNWRR